MNIRICVEFIRSRLSKIIKINVEKILDFVKNKKITSTSYNSDSYYTPYTFIALGRIYVKAGK